jgi:hypothetical protein
MSQTAEARCDVCGTAAEWTLSLSAGDNHRERYRLCRQHASTRVLGNWIPAPEGPDRITLTRSSGGDNNHVEACTCFDYSHNDLLMMRAVLVGLGLGLRLPEGFGTDDLFDALGFHADSICSAEVCQRVTSIVRSARRG